MNQLTMTQRKKPPPVPKKRSVDPAFDIWLTRGLHQMFDDVASEPIPDELLRLIQEDKEK